MPKRATLMEAPEKFFGVGFYEVRVSVRDADGAASRVVSKRWLTRD